MMEQLWRMAPLGRSQERSSIDVIGLRLSAEVNLLGEGGGVFMQLSVCTSMDFLFCCLTQCAPAAQRRERKDVGASSFLSGIPPVVVDRFLALSSENPTCFRLVESAWTACWLFSPVNNYLQWDKMLKSGEQERFYPLVYWKRLEVGEVTMTSLFFSCVIQKQG